MIVYTVLAIVAALFTGSPMGANTWLSMETVGTGLMNLLHVLSSYTAFEQLAGGNAMALFYTYPVWNILGAAALFKESVPLSSLPWIGLALCGAVGLAQPSTTNWTLLGVLAALTAALTETGIYLWFRSHKDGDTDQPWTKMIQMYGSSGVFWFLAAVVLGAFSSNVFSISTEGLHNILLFNALVGFTGYALRFYIIPKVSTIAFSSLSFVGIFAAYILGWIFTKESPTLVQGLGALAIVIANTILLRRETS